MTKDSTEILKKVRDVLANMSEEKRREKTALDNDRKYLITGIGKDIVDSLTPILSKMSENSRISKEELKDIFSELKVEIPPIEFPKFPDLPKPHVTVTVAPAKIPEIKIPAINIPKSEINFPSKMGVNLLEVTKKNPIPVILTDDKGNPYVAGSFIGGSGGSGPRIVGLIDKRGNEAAWADLTNEAFRVNVVAGSVSLTGNDTNSGPAGANTLRMTQAVDVGVSTNIIQINGNAIATGSGEQNSNTLRVAFATDSGATVSIGSANVNQWNGTTVDTNIGPSGAGTLRVTEATDSVSSINIVQINGNAIATGSGEQNSNTLRVAFATDSSASVSIGAVNVNQWNGTTVDTNIGPSGAGTLRTTIATDAVASTNVTQLNGSTTATDQGVSNAGTLRVVHAVDVATSVNIIAGSIANTGFNITGQDENSGPAGANTLRVTQAVDVATSTNIIQVNGSAIATGLGEANTNTLRVMEATDSTTSTNVVQLGGSAIALNSGVANAGTLRQIHVTDIGLSAKTIAVAMTTNPTAASDAADTFIRADKLGRLLNTPVQVRQLRSTAYVALSTGTEATLLASAASTFNDLIYITAANNSSAAVAVDVRSATAAGIVLTLNVPANGTTGVALPVPLPQNVTADTWTVDMPDITGTTVWISALFSQET